MIQAIFFDIDGTLVSFQTHCVSSPVLDALHQLHKKGIKLFLATGRHRNAIAAAANVFPFDGFITLNGQYCFTQEQVLRRNPIPQDKIVSLVALLEDTKLPCILFEEQDNYLVNPSPRAELFPQQLNIPLPPVLPLQHILGRTVYQVVAFFTKEEERAIGPRFFPGLEVMRWHPDFVDVIALGGGKDRGMDTILSHFGIPLEATMAFGDGENDLPMLHHAHIGVAMGNADALVKRQADCVTHSVDEDGVLTALEQFGLL